MVVSIVFNKLRGLEPATLNLFRPRYFSWIIAVESWNC